MGKIRKDRKKINFFVSLRNIEFSQDAMNMEQYSFRIFKIKLDGKNKATRVSSSISINVTQRLDYTRKKNQCYFKIKLIVTVFCRSTS